MSFNLKSKEKFAALLAALIISVSVTGCANTDEKTSSTNSSTATKDSVSTASIASDESLDSDMFTDRDKEVGYDESSAVIVAFSSSGATASSDSVSVSGSKVNIKSEGTYIVTGTTSDGQIIVDADNKTKVQIVLKNASLTCKSSAALYVKQADKVFVTTAKDTENTLASTGDYVQTDDNNVDAAVFAKDDITFNGEGKLTVTSEKGHGIVSKDDLKLTSGEYNITAASYALSGKNSIRIASGTYTLTSGKDGLHTENTDDTSKGFVYIADGKFTVNCKGDGIDAGTTAQIENGTFYITSNRGSSSSSSTDSASVKGIKAGGDITISGGTFNLTCEDDGLHSNSNVTVSGGTFTISTGDDGIHADSKTSISGGIINITESYEGIEGTEVEISGGTINLKSSNDGFNAAGGKDESGFGGGFDRDNFGSSDASITISGGKITIDADGDGVDSNGSLTVTGGETYVSGSTSGDNGAVDYDGEATITGGIFIATGSSQMAQNFGENSTQGSMLVNTNSSGEITVKNSDGDVLVSFTPTKTYACVVISCPGITTGQTYTVTTGDSTTEVEMTSIIYGSGSMGGPGSMGGRNMGNGDMNGNEMGGPGGDMRGGPQMR